MLDHAAPLTWRTPPEIPVETLVLGKPVEDVAALLPRVFNLCRGAQEAAARLALGLPQAEDADQVRHVEILRDHVLMLCVRLPGHFGMAPLSLPAGWVDAPERLRAGLLPPGRMPLEHSALDVFLAQGGGLWGLLSRIRDSFAAGEATCDALPVPEGEEALMPGPWENSVAGRWVRHPLMCDVERRFGRGPLWRVLGRVVELEALMSGMRLPMRATPKGEAFVPAARGTYAVAAQSAEGMVTGFRRVTPTDHLLAPGGVMEQALARLPTAKRGLAPLLVDILDPCVPLRLEDVSDA